MTPHVEGATRQRPWRAPAAALLVALLLAPFAGLLDAARQDASEAALIRASGGRTVRVGTPGRGGGVRRIPLELYVARVIAGEGEPKSAPAAQDALAIAIRTFALANTNRHRRHGFDLCDSTHCQVLRPSTAASRRAALATAGQVLTRDGMPAEIFYSASCGGRTESAAAMWPGANYPYLGVADDDVHGDEAPWVLEMPRGDLQRALARAGFAGTLKDVRVEARTDSGRVSRLQIPGMRPEIVAGEQFRQALGPRTLRSTAFDVEERAGAYRFVGRGYGHGVGMCVIGAGKRAARGEDAARILGHYFPGLSLTGRSGAAVARPAAANVREGAVMGPPDSASSEGQMRDAAPGDARAGADLERDEATVSSAGVAVTVPSGSTLTASAIVKAAAAARHAIGRRLGVEAPVLSVQLHPSLESFRRATSRPWWVSAVVDGTSIELAPAAVLAQRDGVDAILRIAVAEVLVQSALPPRPAWLRAGAARYFARDGEAAAPEVPAARFRCPSDAELRLAISATAQRDADARAEACFRRALARYTDWRAVRP